MELLHPFSSATAIFAQRIYSIYYLYSGTVLLLHRQVIFSGTASTNYTLEQHITSTSYYGLEQFLLIIC